MHPDLVKVAESGLKQLRIDSQADLLTCYFLNPYSGLFWLFFRDGEFSYDGQMHGPLTHPGQTERLLRIIKDNGIVETGLLHFHRLPESLSRRINDVEPFVVRERIVRSAWVAIPRDSIRSEEGFDRDICQQDVAVLVFLNYRDENRAKWNQSIEGDIRVRVKAITPTLQILAEQPCILEKEAWKLRNMSLRFIQELEGVLVVGDVVTVGERLRALSTFVTQQACELVQPEPPKVARNLLCTLTVTDLDGRSKLIACYPKEKWEAAKKATSGVIDYVCRAGRIYLIEDTETYTKRWRAENRKDPSRPKYVVCDPKTRCELACPLVLQERVVGVLNIEADTPKAYKNHHILMMLQLASLAALVVRQTVVWKSLSECITRQSSLLHGGMSQNDQEILAQTLQAAEELGFHAEIWDSVKETWKKDKKRGKPRKDGYTSRILREKTPLAIADIRKCADGTYDCRLHKGRLNQDTLLFEAWGEEETAPQVISEASSREADLAEPVLTNLGLPIFEHANSARECSPPAVRAVLWAKCHRRFMSLLYDESWALSFLCRNASMALDVRNKVRERFEARETYVRFHFGDKRGRQIDQQLQRDETSLEPKAARDIVVLNVDIRGSTIIGQKLLSQNQTKEYVDFIKDYHQSVFEKVERFGGIIDKTMGDGVQLLFNVYRPGLINLPPYDNQIIATENAIRCVAGVFRSFADFWKSEKYQAWHWKGGPFGLGAGLATGEGFAGSFSEVRTSGMDYTVIGDVANNAGKLVGFARQSVLAEWIEVCSRGPTRRRMNRPSSHMSNGERRTMDDGALTELQGKLTQHVRGLSALVVDPISADSVSTTFLRDNLLDSQTSAYRVVDPDSKLDYLWIIFEPML